MKKAMTIMLTLCLIFSLTACGGTTAPASSVPAPVSPAAEEYAGTVMLYTSTGEDVVLKLKEAFETKYPKVKLEYYYAGSGNVVTKLSTEFVTSAVSCDLVWLAEPDALITWKDEGNLTAYESPYAADIDVSFKDADNFYTAARMVLMGISYSTVTCSDEIAPHAYWDLTKEQFANQVVMSDPANSGSTKSLVYALTHNEKYGWEFFEALKANGCELESSSGNTMNKIAAAAYQMGIGVDYNTRNMAADGAPIGFHDTTDIVAVACPIGIPKGSPNEKLAKLLYDFILNPEEGQYILANNCNMTPANANTALPKGMMPSNEVAKVMLPIDWADLAANGADMINRFDTLFK